MSSRIVHAAALSVGAAFPISNDGDFCYYLQEQDSVAMTTDGSNTAPNDIFGRNSAAIGDWTSRWVQRVSKFWERQSQSKPDSYQQPDRLEHDFVVPTESTFQRLPNDYNKSTVLLAAEGAFYLHNPFKQKV